jgi:dimethylhistidine N-methyltransferase
MTETVVLRLRPAKPAPESEIFAGLVVQGLAARPRVLPARFFYDQAGSELFEAITALPEYYPTRTEAALLAAQGEDIARLVGPGRAVVEFGAGSAAKTPLLLRHLAPSAYVPVDISGPFMRDAARALADAHPGLAVFPVTADFTESYALPHAVRGLELLGFFPGSTIGNFSPERAVDLLRRFRSVIGAGGWLVIGIDTRKDLSVLLPAYDDAAGVTARFNLNLLARINRELGADIPLEAFAHEARWNEAEGRIEMHLRARRALSFDLLGRRQTMARGETIHTENSYKYTLEQASMLGRAAGFTPRACWTDAAGLFSLHAWRVDAETPEP